MLALLPCAAAAAPPNPLPRGTAAVEEASRLHSQIDELIEKKGHYDEALPLAERALALCEKNLPPTDPRLAQALHDLAETHAHRGDVAKAEPFYRKSLAIYEKKPGKNQLDLATLLDHFASALTNIQRLDEAQGMFERALKIAEQVPETPGKKLHAQALNNLAGIQYYRGNYNQAIALFQKGLAAMEEALGADDPAIAMTASNLAAVLDALGRGAEAKPHYLRALAIREKALGPEHPDVASTLSNLGVLASNEGDMLKATELHERALAIREKVLGPEHPAVAVSLNNLASIMEDRGNTTKAKAFYERALSISEKKLGPKHPNTIQILHNYAAILMNLHDPAAGVFLVRLMDIQRTKDPKTFDLTSMDTSLWIAQLALQIDLGAEARELAEIVLEAIEAKLSPTHYRAALCLAVIGSSYQLEGNYRQAASFLERAVAVGEKALGPHHAQYARLLWKHADMLAESGAVEQALRVSAKASEIDEHNLKTVLGAGSEAQKRGYAASNARNADRAVSIHIVGAPTHPQAIELGLLTVLRRKGRVLDALVDGVAALRNRLSKEDAALLDELAALRGVVARMAVSPPATLEDKIIVSAAEKKIEELEAQISNQSAPFRQAESPITIQAIQASIPAQGALVEMFLWHPIVKQKQQFEHYVAYILHRDGPAHWLDLGEAERIDKVATQFLSALRDPGREDISKWGRELDALLMHPIRKQLGNAHQIIFSPDGLLNLVPIGALIGEDGKYLVENYAISYVVSGRDLMHMGTRTKARSEDVVVANPNFGAKPPSDETAPKDRAAAGLSGAFFGALPGTKDEAVAIGHIFPHARILTQADATEKAFKELHGPRLLHVATHGFFLRGAKAASASTRGLELELSPRNDKKRKEINPLVLSGLALAQANSRPSEGEDGILTALEASALDLWGTQLVVLSACETGLGELENGEGVSGLRRALFTAGAESAMMSLWKVDDDATRDLMVGVYERLAKGGGRAESLRQAQLDLLHKKEFEHPYFWASFVELGDYRRLDGTEPELHFEAARVAPPTRGCACETAKTEDHMNGSMAGLGLIAAELCRRIRRRAPANAR